MLLDHNFLRLLENLELLVKKTQSTHLVGQRISKRLGGGMEFNDYRQYQRGDDYRYIDWNLYSRLEQLFLKQFVEERDYLVYFLMDQSRSMGYGQPTKLNYACQFAAAIGYIALARLDRVGALAFGSDLGQELRPRKGKGWTQSFFRFLEQLEPNKKTDLNHALSLFGHKYKQSGLVVVLSDFLDPQGYQQGVLELCSAGWQVWLIQVLNQDEINPPQGEDLYLIDSETLQSKEVYLSEGVVGKYQQTLQSYCEEIKEFSNRYGVYHLQLTTDTPLEQVMFQTLRKEGGLK